MQEDVSGFWVVNYIAQLSLLFTRSWACSEVQTITRDFNFCLIVSAYRYFNILADCLLRDFNDMIQFYNGTNWKPYKVERKYITIKSRSDSIQDLVQTRMYESYFIFVFLQNRYMYWTYMRTELSKLKLIYWFPLSFDPSVKNSEFSVRLFHISMNFGRLFDSDGRLVSYLLSTEIRRKGVSIKVSNGNWTEWGTIQRVIRVLLGYINIHKVLLVEKHSQEQCILHTTCNRPMLKLDGNYRSNSKCLSSVIDI